MTKTTLIEFPCLFPIKIIGINSQQFIDEIKGIVFNHFPHFSDEFFTYTESKQNNYVAITVTVLATDQTMLDNFYKEISQHPSVKMVL